MRKNRIAVMLLAVILIMAEISQVCFAFPSVLDDVPEKKILVTETSAGTFSDENVIRAFKLLNYLDVISENKEEFDENAVVSRAYAISAFAAMFSGFRSSGTAETFSDVPANHAYAAGIWQALEFGILDNSQSKFYPNKNASYEDIAIWALKTLKFDIILNNRQPLAAANEMGFFKGINTSGSAVTMGQFLRILENVLNTNLVSVNMSSEGFTYTVDNTKTLLNEKYDVYLQDGILTGYKYSSMYGDIDLDADEVEINKAVYKTDEELSVDYVGRSICAYVDNKKDNKIISLWTISGRNNTYEVTKKEYNSFETSYIQCANSKKIRVNSGIRVLNNNIFDNSYYNAATIANLPKTDKIVVLDNDGDGVGDLIKAYTYTHYYVKGVSVISGNVAFGNDGGTISTDTHITEFLFEGKPIESLADLKSDDILTAMEGTQIGGRKVFAAEISRDKVVEGKITSIGKDNVGTYYYIEGTRYYVSQSLKDYMDTNSANKNLGDYIQAYISVDKKIVRIKTENDLLYGYVMDAKYRPKADETVLTLYTQEGNKEKLSIAETVKIYSSAYMNGKKMNSGDAYNEFAPGGTVNNEAIMYALDTEGKIKQVVFALDMSTSTTTPGSISYPLVLNLDEATSGTNYRLYRGIYKAKYTMNNTTPVILIPDPTVPANAALITDEKAYQLTTGNKFGTVDHYFTGQTIKAYNCDKYYTPQFYVVTGEASSKISQGDKGGVHLCVIDKIYDKYNAEDDTVLKTLCYYDNTTYKEVTISDEVQISQKNIFCTLTSADQLKKGDIIQFRTNLVGEIDLFTLYFRISEYATTERGIRGIKTDASDLTFSSDISSDIFNIGIIYGTVKDIDGTKASIETGGVTESIKTGPVIIGHSAFDTPYYIMYDLSDDTITPASLSEVHIGDKVVMRRFYNHVLDVVIIRD